MITLTKYAVRIVLQIFALFGLTFIYSIEKVNDAAFDGEGGGAEILTLIIGSILFGLTLVKFL